MWGGRNWKFILSISWGGIKLESFISQADLCYSQDYDDNGADGKDDYDKDDMNNKDNMNDKDNLI